MPAPRVKIRLFGSPWHQPSNSCFSHPLGGVAFAFQVASKEALFDLRVFTRGYVVYQSLSDWPSSLMEDHTNTVALY